ncbi:putative choline transporter, neither null mutation nor overexpression affects choline transport [Aphanomyces cochlioides]|nr:putative choline transporter, neither null mutation nor overexpression affects choline transport [Aphanomyces cochlioides]
MSVHVARAPTTCIQVIKPDRPADASAWKDAPFAVLFCGHVIAIIVVMIVLGLPLLTALNGLSATDFDSSDMKTIVAFSGCMAVVASLVAYALVNVVVAYAKDVISIVLWANFTLCIVFAVIAIAAKVAILAVIFILCALFNLCYNRMVRSRIPFAAANLHVAAAAVKEHWSIFPLAFIMMAFQVVWIFIWCVALIGVILKLDDSAKNPNGFPMGHPCVYNLECQSRSCGRLDPSVSHATCLDPTSPTSIIAAYVVMLLSLYWGVTVLKNVLHTTVAGVVATWWTAGDSKGVIKGSFHRAMTTSFGSICLGSLIVAILRTLESIANSSKKDGSVAGCIAECILSFMRSIVEYFNRWAFIYVAMYGFRFTQAGKCASGLFKQRGLSAVVNDDFVGQTLAFVSLICGLICGILGLIYTYIDPKHTSFTGAEVLFPIIGLAFGIGVTVIPLGVIDSAVATVFVCFAEDPASFGRTHAALHNDMVAAWRLAYPDIMLVFYPA